MAPAWVRPYLAGALSAATIAGSLLLVTRPRHDALEIVIATPATGAVTVAVSGEVARPGLYQLPSGSRVSDLVQRAGGATERADPATPSRALLLREEMHVHVPAAPTPAPAAAQPATAQRPGGAGAAPAPATATISPPATRPAEPTQPPDPAGAAAPPPAGAAATPSGETAALIAPPPAPAPPAAPTAAGGTPVEGQPTASAPPPATPTMAVVATPTEAPTAAARGRTPTPAPTGPINLNTADAAELERLPGIGTALAARIIADRERNGPFRRVEDLDRVSGIGPATIARLRPLVTV